MFLFDLTGSVIANFCSHGSNLQPFRGSLTKRRTQTQDENNTDRYHVCICAVTRYIKCKHQISLKNNCSRYVIYDSNAGLGRKMVWYIQEQTRILILPQQQCNAMSLFIYSNAPSVIFMSNHYQHKHAKRLTMFWVDA